ncbi:tetratricopeptide repeat protein [Oscillatoria sp. FACHB-1407]|uniref:tetratricopeptide repeat protein n=1 Tax=Oscillatoria sp. FACHB-1407 TaxID=2692847 RepID=UPI00168261C3|nr:tetratricopeptide repeat protein [Oscillatoria sp. FACHB-1407]MBD2462157.1 tetratricopeptide repeat protein [Oscillatoria sp. FACHB-1407]
MKYISFPQPGDKRRSPLLWLVLVGLPLTTAALLVTQSDWRDRTEQWLGQVFSPLDAPYQYPFQNGVARVNPTGRITEEIGFYQEQLRQDPQNALDRAALALAYLRMARATGQNNWYVLAEESARQSLVQLPHGNVEAIAVLARIAEARHDFAGALQLTEQMPRREAIALQVTANLALGNLEEASQAAEELVDLTLSTHAFTLQAMVKTAQGKDEAALQSFQYALEVEEQGELTLSARVRTLLGRYYYERGQLGLAEDLYEEALRIVPQYPPALLNLAQLDIRQGRYGAAKRRYDQLVAGANGAPTVYDSVIWRGQARINLLQGDRAGAEALWSQAEVQLRQSLVGVDAGSFGHRRDLARLLLERGRSQDIAEAVTLMEAEVQLRRDTDTLSLYAWALSEAGQRQQANAVIEEAIAQGTRDPDLFYRASAIAQALGDATQAQAYGQEAKAIDPLFDDGAQRAAGLGTGLGS